MAHRISLVIENKGWVMLCHVEHCPNSMVIRFRAGEEAQAVLHALQHVRDHHWNESVEIHCTRKDIVEMVQSNSNPRKPGLVSEINLLYRALPRCVLKAVGEKEVPEAYRLAKLIPYLSI